MNAYLQLVHSAILLLLLAAPSGVRADGLVIDDFERGLDPEWTIKSFKGDTTYKVVSDNDNQVLQADSRGTASGLVRKLDLDPRDFPILSWRWKISATIPRGDERVKAGDDYAARVYVIFPHWFFLKTRTLNYIWANHLPKEEFLLNAYTGNAMMIAVESGPDRAGQWLVERRDIAADFRKAFGEDPPRIGAIAIMTDTDNTGAAATGWYDDLRFER